jgi:hypothetical protein
MKERPRKRAGAFTGHLLGATLGVYNNEPAGLLALRASVAEVSEA